MTHPRRLIILQPPASLLPVLVNSLQFYTIFVVIFFFCKLVGYHEVYVCLYVRTCVYVYIYIYIYIYLYICYAFLTFNFQYFIDSPTMVENG